MCVNDTDHHDHECEYNKENDHDDFIGNDGQWWWWWLLSSSITAKEIEIIFITPFFSRTRRTDSFSDDASSLLSLFWNIQFQITRSIIIHHHRYMFFTSLLFIFHIQKKRYDYHAHNINNNKRFIINNNKKNVNSFKKKKRKTTICPFFTI